MTIQRPQPELHSDDLAHGRPLPRGGVSPQGSAISWVTTLWALTCLCCYLFEVGCLALGSRAPTSGWRWAGQLAGLGAQWLALLVAAFHLILAVGMQFETRRIRPFISREERRLMLNLMTGSWAAPVVYAAWRRYIYVGIAAPLAAWYFGSLRPLTALVAVASLYYWGVIRVTTPPAAVLLGTSDISELRWHWTLLNIARPLRIVSCLDVQNAETRWRSWELTFDCLRAFSSDGWWDLVQALLHLAPLIVIDTTVSTPHLVREAQSLQHSGLLFKCVALSGPAGECPLLDVAGIPQDEVCALRAPEVLRFVEEVLASGELPEPEWPAAELARSLGLDKSTTSGPHDPSPRVG